MYKWRILVGRVEPGMWGPPEAYEWLKVVPKDVGLMITVSGLQNLTLDEVEKARSKIVDSVKKLAAEGVDVIDVGGSPVLGYRGYKEYQNFLTSLKQVTSIPLVTALTAEFDGLKALGVKKVVVATPYPENLNQNRKQLLEDSGFKVLGLKGVGESQMAKVNRLPDAVSYKMAREVYEEHPEADGIYIACPGWPVVDNIAKLEKDLKRPVVTNVQAQVWACLRAAGIKDQIKGFGKLLTLA